MDIQQIPQQQQVPAPVRICYQMSTTNKSFLTCHYMLKALGIKNNRFMLALIDPDLAGVSPYDPNLSFIMKQKILREVQNNFWYFLREVVRIPTPGVPGGMRYMLHRGNLAMNYCMMYNLNVFMELPRQQGKTISADCRYLWVYNFGTSSSEITFLNKKLQDSKLNLSRLKEIRDALPSYLQMTQTLTVNGKKSKPPATVEYIKNAVNGNEIKTAASARSSILATNLLRGRTLPLLWADEWAFIPFNKEIYLNTIPAIKTAAINARNAGKPYGILLTTTPGILSTDEGKYANKMRLEATEFSELWYDLTYQQIQDIIDANTISKFVYIRFDYKQIGRDEKWFNDIAKDLNWDYATIRREILLEWSDSPENCPFSKEDLDVCERYVRQPVDIKQVLNVYELRIYDNTIPLRPDFVPKYPPIIGVDVSGGYNQDYSTITIIDSQTTKVLADMRSNSISPINLARAIYEITKRWYPNAVINVERNGGFGASVIAKLMETDIKRNLYYEIKDRVLEESSDGIRIIRKKQKTKVYGLDSTRDTRQLLIELLRERMNYHKDKFISGNIVKELKTMETKKSGKVEHADGQHDDQVFSYLMAMYVWYEGKDIRERYNIQKNAIKTDTNTIDEIITGMGIEQSDIVKEIEYIQRDPEDQTFKNIAIMNKGAGIMLKDFINRQRKKEDDMFRMMLQNRVIKEAYARDHNLKPDDVASMFHLGSKTIPDSILMNFYADEDETLSEQLAREELYKRQYEERSKLR